MAVGRIAAALPALIGSAPDPELTARMFSTVSDESARLHLADPERYPVDRLMRQARWFLERVLAG
jgi:hypothetical protein